MNETASFVYQFGPFTLDPGRGLSRAGTFVPLPPKEFALLEFLVAQQGEVASHKQLWEIVWPNQEISNDSITRCVYMLRRILGGKHQFYIATVPRKGYRIAVPVTKRTCNLHDCPSLIEKSIKTIPIAYSHFLQGMRESNLPTEVNLQRAIELYELAYQADSNYAVPLGNIADCRIYQSMRGWIIPREGEKLTREACSNALRIDPKLVSAISALGWIEGVIQRRTELGLRLIEDALVLDPCYARALSYRGWILRGAGLLDEAIEALRQAVDLDPHSVLYVHSLAWTLFCAGHHLEALELERKMRSEMPWSDAAHGYVSIFASWLRFEDEAVEAGYRLLDLSKDDSFAKAVMAYTLARTGNIKESHIMLKDAEAASLPVAPRAHLAMVYAELNKKQKVIEWLTLAKNEHCPWFAAAQYDPRLGSMAKDAEVLKVFTNATDQFSA